jgi:hypothetical protein
MERLSLFKAEPVRQAMGMIRPDFGSDAESSAEEGDAHLPISSSKA